MNGDPTRCTGKRAYDRQYSNFCKIASAYDILLIGMPPQAACPRIVAACSRTEVGA